MLFPFDDWTFGGEKLEVLGWSGHDDDEDEIFPEPEVEPAPDPFLDPDPLEDLGDRILALSRKIERAGYRLLVMIAEFDRLRGWELAGHSSTADWLAAYAGLDPATAREKVRTARALERLPRISVQLAMGALSFSQARALTRVATVQNEAEILNLTRGYTTAQIERFVRGWRMKSAKDELDREEERQRMRSFAIYPAWDGMYEVRGRLTPEQGAVLMRAIEAASDVLFREETPGAAYEPVVRLPDGARLRGDRRSGKRAMKDSQAQAARRRADGIALLAERALGVGFGAGGCDVGDEGEDAAERAADETASGGAGDETATRPDMDSPPAPLSGSRAERYQVTLRVDLEAIARRSGDAGGGVSVGADTNPGATNPGASELDDGVRVSAETSRRLCCDSALVPIFVKPDGSIHDVGHRRRTVNASLRRALDARDGGCRFPACGKRFTEAHHVRHWADGGETSLENCVLLCRHHHRLLHEGRWTMEALPGGRLRFRDPNGGLHYDGRFDGNWSMGRSWKDEESRLAHRERIDAEAEREWLIAMGTGDPGETDADLASETVGILAGSGVERIGRDESPSCNRGP